MSWDRETLLYPSDPRITFLWVCVSSFSPTAGVVSSSTSLHGPVSPTVSFQLLGPFYAQGKPLSDPQPAPSVGTSSSSIGLTSAGGAGDQAEGTICSSGAGVPNNPMTASTVPPRCPPIQHLAAQCLPKLPTSLKPSGNTTSLAPSRLPINSVPLAWCHPKCSLGKKTTTGCLQVASKVPAFQTQGSPSGAAIDS